MDSYLQTFDLEKREREVQRALEVYNANKGPFSFIDGAPLKITGVYYKILSNHVKPLIPKKVNKFKMASLMALTIVTIQPIIGDISEKELRRKNAELAFFVAMNLILDMANPDGYDKQTGIKFIDDSIKAVKDQHISYLSAKEKMVHPIFPIGSFYFCFFVLFQSKYNVLSN